LKSASKDNDIIKKRGYELSDLRFLCRRTGLRNEKKMMSLIEENKDLDLIISNIKDLPLIKRQTSRLSLRFLLFLLVHKLGNDKIKNEHKQLVASISADYFSLITGSMDTNVSIDFSKPPDEGDAKLLFVLNGLFGEYFARFFNDEIKYKQIRDSHIKYIKKGLATYGAEEWVDEGLEILQKITEEGWIRRFYK